MRATPEEINGLLKLQQTDLALLKARKEFDGLPQRAVIREAREKRAAVLKKQEQAAELRRRAEAAASKLEDEDASLAEKQCDVQAAIDGARGDYRNVEARTKELNGIAKRRAALEEELSAQADELEKIGAVQAQIDKALSALAAREEEATASFAQAGGELKAVIGQLEAKRAQAEALLGAELKESYARIAAAHGGVAVGVLREGKCGACRMPIEAGRLVDLKRQAPLGACPHCKRLLVIG